VPVLAQRADAVRRYVEETGLPFNILVDESRRVVRAYGVWQRLGLDAWNISRPALFLIDSDGSVRYSFIGKSQEEFPAHKEILRAIEAG
jgi:peroxiredoxin